MRHVAVLRCRPQAEGGCGVPYLERSSSAYTLGFLRRFIDAAKEQECGEVISLV